MINLESFTNPRLTPFTQDTFIIRSTILAAVKQATKFFSGTLIDVGCGQMPYKEMILSSGNVGRYIGLDFEKNDIYRNMSDLTWDGKKIPLEENSVDCAMATELLEHCPEPEVVMMEICRILRPGGILFITVPFLWPLHDIPNDQYRYTPFALKRLLVKAGFHDVRLKALGGWDESLAQMLGLYARRRPVPGYARFFVSLLTFPMVFFLSRHAGKSYRHSSGGQNDFLESAMISGVSGIAFKPEAGRDQLQE